MELKGYLKPIILKLLSREDEKTGSELAEEIEDVIGSKPSYGSIYPVLQKLREKNLVEVEKKRQEKRYSLSERGKELVGELEERKREHTESLLSMLRTFKTIFEDEDIDLLIKSIERRREGKGPHFPELQKIHHLLLTSDAEGKEKEVREELRETFENLEEILEG